MKKSIAALVAPAALCAALIAPSAAQAGTTEPIDYYWGGGTASVDLPDFRYPGEGCYNDNGTFTLTGNDIYSWDHYYVALDVYDSTGRYTDFLYSSYQYTSTSLPVQAFLCSSFDQPGTYSVSGTVTFVDSDYNSYDVPLSDTFVVSAPLLAAAAPASIPAAAAVAVAPAHLTVAEHATSGKCKKAKKALKKAKRQDKPFSVIKKAKRKVNHFC